MFEDFILALRGAGVPASLTEYLALLGAMNKGVAAYSVEDFYYLSRAALVKDERHIDRFRPGVRRLFSWHAIGGRRGIAAGAAGGMAA